MYSLRNDSEKFIFKTTASFYKFTLSRKLTHTSGAVTWQQTVSIVSTTLSPTPKSLLQKALLDSSTKRNFY